jgi:hypothetical protein
MRSTSSVIPAAAHEWVRFQGRIEEEGYRAERRFRGRRVAVEEHAHEGVAVGGEIQRLPHPHIVERF